MYARQDAERVEKNQKNLARIWTTLSKMNISTVILNL